MPNVGVHLLLADRVLKSWSSPVADPPFQLTESTVSAFVYGTLLPDAGYFPRGDRFFSDLAHRARTADLLRALVAGARTATQTAHAWGWATHLLADLEIHPLINEAHGEQVRGSRQRPLTSAEDEAGHMRLEYGLDAAVLARHPEIRQLRPALPPPTDAAENVVRAYRSVFSWSPTVARVSADQAAARRMVWLGVLVNRIHAAEPGSSWFAASRAAAILFAPPKRWLPRSWNRSGAAQALLTPASPPEWLLERIDEVADSFGQRVDRLRGGELATLENRDLTTGLPEVAEGAAKGGSRMERTLLLRRSAAVHTR